MQKVGFSEGLEEVVKKDPRFDRDAYVFLREALEHTVRHIKRDKESVSHVNAGELLEGFRLLALKEFGPMAPSVLDFWGVKNCHDVGSMVFNLVDAGVFGKTEKDDPDDFGRGYSFHEAFVAPFLPARRRGRRPRSRSTDPRA